MSSNVVDGACEKHPLCVISFLPHILDCDAACRLVFVFSVLIQLFILDLIASSCRNGHIDNLKKLGEKYKKKDWGWLWMEAMAQPKLEEAVSDNDLTCLPKFTLVS